MRTRFPAAMLAASIFAACSSGETAAKLTITPGGAQTISGPTLITASPAELANQVTWSLSGPGSLSGTSGLSVVYRPPVPADPTPATVTASAQGQTATVTFTGQTPQQVPHTIAGLTAAVDVTYDQFDIPHIFCANQNDCYAAQGYIQAQDRLFEMDLFRRTARGRLAALVGSPVVAQDQQFLTLFITRDLKRIEDVLVSNLDTATAAKLQAFTNGVNAYIAFLKQNPTLMPQEYAQLPGPPTPNDIPDWEPADSLALGRLQQFQLSETIEKETNYGLFALTFGPVGSAHRDDARFAAYVRAEQPVKEYTLSDTDPGIAAPRPPGGPQPAAAPDLAGMAEALGHINAQMRELNTTFGSLREGAGSNNWVVDAAHSESGHAMVANDPHLSLLYPPLFHLSAMTASDGTGLNVAGGTFPGVPGALIGRGAHVGWGVTVVGYDVTDLYREQLTDCTHPPPLVCGAVQFNGNPVAIAVKPYAITVRSGGGSTTTNIAVLVVPHHGPILNYDPAHQTAISMRWTGHEGNTQDLKAFLDLNNATAVGDDSAAAGTAFAALKNYAVGAQNFVLADDQGNIGYDPHALVPRRDWLFMTANPSPPWFPLPGDGSEEWGGDPACAAIPPAATCWVPDTGLPRGVNPQKGYFATANSDPAGYTDDNVPLGNLFPSANSLYPYLSFDWDDPTAVRYGRIVEMLKAFTTSGNQKVSLTEMQQIQSDHISRLAKIFEDRHFYPDTGTVNQAAYTSARAVLTDWSSVGYDCPTGLTGTDPNSSTATDTTVLKQSAGCLLFHTFLLKLIHNVFDDDFAVVTASTGQSFSGDAGAEIRALAFMLATPGTHAFCDDVSTSFNVVTAKTCETQVVNALVTAIGTLQAAYGTNTSNWLWGRVHTLTLTSAGAPLIGPPFKAGPFARPGGALTVDVGNPNSSQASPLGFAYGSGSNVRFIAVMDPANAQVKMQLPGPERDGPFGVFSSGPNLLSAYVQNQYFDFLYGHQVDGKGLSTQRFTAQ